MTVEQRLEHRSNPSSGLRRRLVGGLFHPLSGRSQHGPAKRQSDGVGIERAEEPRTAGLGGELPEPALKADEELCRPGPERLSNAPRKSVGRPGVEPQERLVILEAREERIDRAQELLARVRQRVDFSTHSVSDGRCCRVNDSLVQLFLALEERVDRVEGELGIVRDLRDLGPLEATLGERRRGGGENVAAPELGFGLAALFALRCLS
ncbi:MAG TPA: hypothetical protein PLW10_12300 [Myxococcota bacterium]|nr:hypothetical protein [Myxococcota bacterium]